MLRDIVAGAVPCPLRHPPHRFNLTLSDVVTGRTHEFRQSLRALGVQNQDIYETGWSDIEPLKDYTAFKLKLRDLIVGYEQKYPGASHKCISGEYDRDSVGRNPTHRACWDVATDLLNEFPRGYPLSNQLWDFRFYRTYTYYNPPTRRSAQYIRALPHYLRYKQHALDQYKRWDPSKGELAWGYHSVKPLIDAAYNDEHVYMDMLDNDPTNPENWNSAGRNKAELEIIHTEGEMTMFPDPLDNLKKDTNIMLFRGGAGRGRERGGSERGSNMGKPRKQHGKQRSSQRNKDHARGRHEGDGVHDKTRMEKQDVEETHGFGDYDIDMGGLDAKIGGQSMGTNAYKDHDTGEAAPMDTNLRLVKEGSKKKTTKKYEKSRSQRKGSHAQGHRDSAKESRRMEEEDVEETHGFGDYDIDMSGLEAKMGGQSMGTNAYKDHDIGEAASMDTNLRLVKEGSKKKTTNKHEKSHSQRKGSHAQDHRDSAKESRRMEEEDVEETHGFGDYDIDMSGLEAKMGGQSMGTNAYGDHGSDDSAMEALLATQHSKGTHAYGDYDIDDYVPKEANVAAVPEIIGLMANQHGSSSTSTQHKPDDLDQMELNEGRNKDQILREFNAATKRPEGKDYKSVNLKRGSSIVLGLVKNEPLE
ncbi:hypothetical protein EC968_007569 [Mortierella alpina]|nr:hypothetical protein EC968_007569 [Mortierella alpina]